MDKKHNHDLLIHDEDRSRAASEYPAVAWVLDFPELREMFAGPDGNGGFDASANTAKRWARRTGVIAIVLVLSALLVAASDWYLKGHTQLPYCVISGLQIFSMIAGVAGGLLGTVRILHGPLRYRWLSNRLKTERLRQLYFQFLARRARKIAAARTEEEQAQLLTERAKALDDFNFRYLRWDGELDQVIDDESARECWFVSAMGPQTPASAPANEDDAREALDQLFAAYRELRFRSQGGYASEQTRSGSSAFSSTPLARATMISRTAFLCVAAMLLLHIGLGGLKFAGLASTGIVDLAHLATIWLALIALAAQVFSEGLRPRQEYERYRWYNKRVRELASDFETASTPTGKLVVMEKMEELSYQELRAFLHGHKEAHFSM